MLKIFLGVCISFCLAVTALSAQQTPAVPKSNPGPSFALPAAAEPTDSVSVTIILKHQQDKNLTELRRTLEAQGFWDVFPPTDARVISWTVAIGLGHIVMLRLPAGAVRRLHLALQNGAWGAFNTEIYMTYDYQPIWEQYLEQRADARNERN
jgi:hypothetical protein